MDRNEEQNGRVQLARTEKTQPVEMTAEITLPDYRSEISRLLWVRPTVLPPTRFIGGGKADFSGPVRYSILYVGPDGRLYGAEAEEGYAFSVPVEQTASGLQGQELMAELSPDAVISRVTGPRKLSVRCRLRAQIREYADKDLTPRVKGADGEARTERLCEAVECKRMLAAPAVQLELSDAAELEHATEEWRLITTDGALFMTDVTATEGGVRCRGEVLLSLLLCRDETEDAAPQVITRRVPFEKEIPMEGVAPDCGVRAMGRVTEVRAAVEEGRILSDIGLMLWGEGQAEESVILCRDMFTPGCVGECQFDEEKLQTAGICGNRHFSVSGEKALTELGMGQDAQPILSVADGEITERRTEGEKTLLLGEVHCHMLYRRDAEYAVSDFSVPFRTAVDGAWDALSISVAVPTCHVSVVHDALRADGEVLLSVCGTANTPTRVLTRAAFSAAEPQTHADLELCYPGAGETLWEVSRRYGVPPETLAAANGLSADAPGEADSLDGVKYLLIP